MTEKKSNILAIKHPELIDEWHPTKNGDLTPFDISSGSHKKVWWQCSINPKHEWQTCVKYRSEGSGCGYCSGKYTTEDNCLATNNPLLASEWHPTKNGKLTPLDVQPFSHSKVWWKCKNDPKHEWSSSVGSRSRGNGCGYCCGKIVSKENSLATINPLLASEWHPSKNGKVTPFDVTANSNKKIWWSCLKDPEHEWETTISSRNKGNGCGYCSGRHVTKENSLLELNPQLASEWHPTKNGKLTPEEITSKSGKKVWWQCPDVKEHEWMSSVANREKGSGCPNCKPTTSIPEKTIFYYLQKIFPDAESGARIESTKKSIDISIPSLKLGVEYDGWYFHQDVERDEDKDKLLDDKGWSLIRVREKGCPVIKNPISIQFQRTDKKEQSLHDSIQFILQTISTGYPLNEMQLKKIYNLSIDLERDKGIIKELMQNAS